MHDIAGGVGKSFLLLILAICLAIKKDFGPFKPTNQYKVLYIGAEDPLWELHRRVYLILKTFGLLGSVDLVRNLAIYSAVGKMEPIIILGPNGNPITAESYDWLRKSIENLKGLDVLILDPMSRLYGLDENNNSHGTAWIHCLETLSQEYNLSIFFSHHEPKSAQGKSLKDSTGRGAISIRDGCRWTASMGHMKDEDAKDFEINNSRDYVEFDISKSNYSPHLPSSVYFKRREGGILEPVSLGSGRLSNFADILANEIADLPEGQEISRADLQLKKEGPGKEIANRLKNLRGFKHKYDMNPTIDYALQKDLLYEKELPKFDGKTGPMKKVLMSV